MVWRTRPISSFCFTIRERERETERRREGIMDVSREQRWEERRRKEGEKGKKGRKSVRNVKGR